MAILHIIREEGRGKKKLLLPSSSSSPKTLKQFSLFVEAIFPRKAEKEKDPLLCLLLGNYQIITSRQ